MPCATDSRFENIGAQEGRHCLCRKSRRARVVRIEPARIELVAQPPRLALGQLTRRKDRPFAKCGGIDGSLKMFPRLSITDCTQRRQFRIEIAARAQYAHL